MTKDDKRMMFFTLGLGLGMVSALVLSSCGGPELISKKGETEAETTTTVTNDTLYMVATKIHTSTGSVFLPATKKIETKAKVPASLNMVEGLGSNDAQAAVLTFFNGSDTVNECWYSPDSTVNSPFQSGNKHQMKLSVTYNLIDCSESDSLSAQYKVTKVKLELNKSDKYFKVTRIMAEVDIER